MSTTIDSPTEPPATAVGPATQAAPSRNIIPANTHQPLPGEGTAVQRRRQWSGPGLWLRWMLATLFSWTAAYAVAGAIAGATGQQESVAAQASGYAFSILTALLQWLVLRPHLPRAWRWLPVSLAAIALGGVIAQVWKAAAPGMGIRGGMADWTVLLLSEALPLAVCQWLLLRTEAQRAWRWLIAYAVWVVLMLPLGMWNDPDGPAITAGTEAMIGYGVGGALVGLVMGFLLGAITGAEIVWLLRHLKRDPEAEHAAPA
ncbi:MAG: hypothetical protein AVDCRST_MAG77-6143 [uncultured Chloroflexi bacterium]|uniref:Uncharacterized protein n=1 Tax=uncultured Chloroflexota bacterium TaxID=166587 RepID=A0A6J4KIU7_9CHLR|nr:MAG: hypothetical protein AVDCRST_MAG77-6143 [uncultured Chloroflexota bacterium]